MHLIFPLQIYTYRVYKNMQMVYHSQSRYFGPASVGVNCSKNASELQSVDPNVQSAYWEMHWMEFPRTQIFTRAAIGAAHRSHHIRMICILCSNFLVKLLPYRALCREIEGFLQANVQIRDRITYYCTRYLHEMQYVCTKPAHFPALEVVQLNNTTNLRGVL